MKIVEVVSGALTRPEIPPHLTSSSWSGVPETPQWSCHTPPASWSKTSAAA
ncbi:hypothetical protein [Streptomyces sasae]|uniref:hypothetical protein n=1 Tax=Streptomyces sasae TaxID=1266772 RepID=UPI003744ACCB